MDDAWKKKWVVSRQGKDFILFGGLMDLGHQQGLKRVQVELLQSPSESNGNTAITKALVETEKGIFEDIGDASPASVTQMIVPHIIRMSSTRAIARCLRAATNIGMTAFEELGEHVFDENDIPDQTQSKPKPTQTYTAPEQPTGGHTTGAGIIGYLRNKIETEEKKFSKGQDSEPKPASEKQIGLLKGLLSKTIGDEQRDICLRFFYKEHNTYKGWSMSTATALIDWCKSDNFQKEWETVYQAYQKKKSGPAKLTDDFEQEEAKMIGEEDIPY